MGAFWRWFDAWPQGAMVLVDVLSSVATAVAAVLAAATIVQAKRQAAAAQAALLHERQIDHRLDLLMHIASENHKSSTVAWVDAGIRMRASLLPIHLVPITRAAMALESTEEAKQKVQDAQLAGNSARESVRKLIDEEIDTAIDVTLDSRPSITAVSGARR